MDMNSFKRMNLKILWREEIKKIKKSPNNVAISLAIGFFIGFTPTIGFQTILCFLFAKLFKKNFIITFIGSSIPTGIPYLIPFVYYGCYKIGSYILGWEGNIKIEKFTTKKMLFWELINFGKPLIVGCLLCGIISGLVVYFLTYFLMRKNEKN